MPPRRAPPPQPTGAPCTQAPAFILSGCVCTQRQVRWSFCLLVLTVVLVTATLALFLSAVHYVKSWVAEKRKLKADVKRLSQHASGVIREAQIRALAPASAPENDDTSPADWEGGMVGATRTEPDPLLRHDTQPIHGARAQGTRRSRRSRRDFVDPTDAATATRTKTSAVAAADPLVHEMLDLLEATRLGSDRRGFVFAFDSLGGVWAHGKTRHLARGFSGRVPGFHCVDDVDFDTGDTHQIDADEEEDIESDGRWGQGGKPVGGSPLKRASKNGKVPRRRRLARHKGPLADMMGAARRGGGYVHFRWKRDALMMAYVHPVKGTDLVLGGAVPVPRNQDKWETANAKMANRTSANGASGGPRRGGRSRR